MAGECDVQSEIEVLESIYLDELRVQRGEDGMWVVSLVLYPSTAEDSVSQFVRLTLTLTLDQQYPSTSPSISIHNPRGLSDDKLSSVRKCLQLEAQSCLGSPVLYQLIEKAKEILTESNIPHGNCVICLFGFKEGETFTKTSCYHYFHCHCLGRYARHSERELRQREKELQEDKTRDKADCQELSVVCPVCREPLTYDVDQLLSSPAPLLPELDEAAISLSFQQKWRKLQKLLERQKSRGGIIDPEEESNRFLIHINQAPSTEEVTQESEDGPALPSLPSASHVSSDDPGLRSDRFGPGPPHCRGNAPGHRRHNQQSRGQRRGGRYRLPHHHHHHHHNNHHHPHPPSHHEERAAPVTEHMDKLSLSPDQAKPQDDTHVNTELRESKSASGDVYEEQPMSQDARRGETENPKDTASFGGGFGGGRGYRGRRRGHNNSYHGGGAGHYSWDGRPSRSRGRANNMYGRGESHNNRGFQSKMADREEVL